MRCVIDIGLEKTGSKVRQMFFANELHRIRELRACYPIEGREGIWHKPLYQALCAGDRSPLDRAANELPSDTDLVIFSFERLHKLRAERIEWLRDRFAQLEVVLFLRRQDDLVSSLWNQRHKAHRVPFSELLDFEVRMAGYQEDLDYRVLIERWESVAGAGRVLPLLYDRALSPVRMFFDRTAVKVDWSGFVETRVNLAVDAYAMSVLRWVKRLAAPGDDLVRLMEHAHEALAEHAVDEGADTRSTIGPELRETIRRHYEDSNEWVRRRYFPDRPRLFPVPGPVHVEPPSEMVGREHAEALVSAVRGASRHQ